jgi:nucleotide-binding universal stress UspA family protein
MPMRSPARSSLVAGAGTAGNPGEVADEVLQVAREIDASVIVIGLRKRSAVGKLLMGSSALRILLDADRPVLAVKP